MFGITISTSSNAAPYWELVERASAFEASPSIRTLGYPPHITFSRYLKIETSVLVNSASALDGETAFSLTFDKIAAFATDPLVLWLSPQPDQRLIDAHSRLHKLVDSDLCDPNYLPGSWRPHLTLATAIDARYRNVALEFAKLPIEPFTLTFDVTDCVSWPPVAILQTRSFA